MSATILLAVALLAIAVLLMGVKALFIRGGRFPQGHMHELRDIGRSRGAWRGKRSAEKGKP